VLRWRDESPVAAVEGLPPYDPMEATFSADARAFACTSTEGPLVVLDLETGAERLRVPRAEAGAGRIALSEDGRRGMLGQGVDCPRCDNLEMPVDARPLRETPVFTADSMPEGLKRRHVTAAGVWGRIIVLEGRLRYVIDAMNDRRFDLTPETLGIVPPEVEHHVEATEPVRFKVAFFETSHSGESR